MKQDQIIEAARQLFYKYGFKKVSMDEIAREAGVTKRTIYMYFSSKEELLKYFIEEELKNMKQIVEEIEKRKDLEFFESVNLGIYKLLKYKKEKDFLNIIAKEGEILKNEIILENLELIDKQIKEYIKEKLELAVKYNNKDARPLYMLSIVEIETGDLDSALDKLLWIIDATENNFEALHNIAYIYFKKKDYDNAISYAKKSLAIFQHKVETYLLLGDIYAIKNKEKESLQFYEMAEMNNLKTFFLYMSWAISLQKFNHHNKAIEKLHCANDCLNSKKVDEVYARLALSYFRTNQKELAIKHKDIALSLNSKNYMANSIAAEIEMDNKDYKRALDYLKDCEEDFAIF